MVLKERYRHMRQNDSTGGAAPSSYRMTVRQLESMIRLSEALARLHCDHQVKAVYVREACRLLKSSIIRVETDNIDLDLAEKEWQSASAALGQDAMRTDDAPVAPPKVSITYEEYVRITNILVHQLRRIEALQELDEEAGEAEEEEQAALEQSGMRKSALIDWYMEHLEAEINTEAEFHVRHRQVSAIIERLVHKDGVLIELSLGDSAAGVSEATVDPILVVHPNYVPQ